jgi:NAD(P)-dependent dehydrogenase (short-subunit alcohol dehydrogenase family)
MPLRLEGKVALVTGASKGIGKGIALELAREGCDVAVNYGSDAAGAAATAEQIRALGRKAITCGADVGSSAAVAAMFDQTLQEFGRVDVLVNNAGVQTWKPLLELEEAEWDRVITTNLKGTFLCTQRAARRMKETGGGSIINIGSGCNKWAFPRLVDYTASKGGIEQFTKVAAVELGKYKIRVNCLAPGAVEIERTKQETGDYARIWGEIAPLGRVGLPVDVGRAAVFFASAESEFITGQTVWIDGGAFTRPAWPYEI